MASLLVTLPTRTCHLSDDESTRLNYTAQQLGEGPSVLIRLGVKLLLGDPLPAWARQIVDELRGDRELIDR